jgi:transcription elongation factor Elf1
VWEDVNTSDDDWSVEVAKRERLRLLKKKKKKTRARHVARQQKSSSPSSCSSKHVRRFTRKESYEYRFECGVCDYGTDKSSSMEVHEEMHAGVRYHCPNCIHKQEIRLTFQMRIRTIHETHKDFKCPMCYKKFSQAGGLFEDKPRISA